MTGATSQPQTSPLDTLEFLTDSSILPAFQPPPGPGWEAGLDVSSLPDNQVEFLRRYFTRGDARFHQGRAAAYAGVTARTVRYWRDNHPAFAEAFDSIQQYAVEEAEQRLFEMVDAGDLRAVTYVLDRIGGKRWSPKGSLDLTSGGEPIAGFRVEVVQPGGATGG